MVSAVNCWERKGEQILNSTLFLMSLVCMFFPVAFDILLCCNTSTKGGHWFILKFSLCVGVHQLTFFCKMCFSD
jgi:hypothetical protein